jgi:vacuolar-type H+-ATPase subunit E/Vma4
VNEPNATTSIRSSGSDSSRNAAPRCDITPAVDPVCEALVEIALQHAEQVRARAIEEARAELASAHTEADRLLARARVEGISAAERIASLQLAAARREAHETVLHAQRCAYERLRNEAVDALVHRATSTEGRMLAERLAALVGERLGIDASVHPSGPDPLVVEARSGKRRASIGPASLVDHVLLSMTDEIEGLWA